VASSTGRKVTMSRTIQTVEDVLRLLDSFFSDDADRWTEVGADWWNDFYCDRERDVPFFRLAPDDSLVEWHQADLLPAQPNRRALDLGCGPGRNAIWLAQRGFTVDALDLSPTALDWARERAAEAQVDVNFVQKNIFGWQPPSGSYDLVYDSGCFHHLPPHRRISYRSLLENSLAPGGSFGLACFAAGSMGSELGDEDLYDQRSLFGGLGYTENELRTTFDWLKNIQLRRMSKAPEDGETFGESFLWAGLFQRAASAPKPLDPTVPGSTPTPT